MFRKALNSSIYRLSVNSSLINRRFSSQIAKTNEEIIKSEEQKAIENKNKEKSDKSVAERVRTEIEKSVKSEEQMDTIWELNQSYDMKKEYNKITDPRIEGHIDLKRRFELWSYIQNVDLSLDGWRKRLKMFVNYREENTQKYIPKRHGILGPDLAISTFVVGRGGRVCFKHSPDHWVTRLVHFPDKYDHRFRVTSVDASDLMLRYEAIDNFVGLHSLESLDLSNNLLDDWSCDKLGRLYRDSNLLALNLSNNPLITNRGIETLHRIRSLKTLKISGTEASKYPFLELLVLSFNDLVPECQIIT